MFVIIITILENINGKNSDCDEKIIEDVQKSGKTIMHIYNFNLLKF